MNNARAEFGRKHRRDAWMQVFEKMEFPQVAGQEADRRVRPRHRTQRQHPVHQGQHQGHAGKRLPPARRLFEKSVANVFDELTRYHNGNTNHTEGWKTNDSYKVNQKLVFPWGCSFDDKYMHQLQPAVRLHGQRDRHLQRP